MIRKIEILDKVVVFVLFCVIMFFAIKMKLIINNNIAQAIVTIFSIIFGFSITSIAMLFGSSVSKKMYKKIIKDRECREIHILKAYFTLYANLLVIAILLIIIFQILLENNVFKDWNYFQQVYSASIYGILFVNFWLTFRFLKLFINSLVEESSVE